LCRQTALPRNDVTPSPARLPLYSGAVGRRPVPGRHCTMQAIPVVVRDVILGLLGIVLLCAASAVGRAQTANLQSADPYRP
jgi:hypothetical protein